MGEAGSGDLSSRRRGAPLAERRRARLRAPGRVRTLAAALVALACLLAAAGCGGEDASGDRTAAQAAHARELRAGARVFAEHCQTCHPLLAKPNTDVHTDYAPPLDLDEVQTAAAGTRAMVENGKVGMPAFGGELKPADVRAVVAYVTQAAGRQVTVPADTAPAQLAAGRRVFDDRCARCHTLGGREPTHPNPIWAGTNFDEVRPSVLYVERMVREGQREAMPSFRTRLDVHQIRAVALYLNAAARGGSAGAP